MMRFLGLMVSSFILLTSFNYSDLEVVRSNYNKLVSDKVMCEKMIDELVKTKEQSPVYLAYLGAAQTIWANHVFSPINKLNTFKKGRENIEKAIGRSPNNVEIRFIRLSVQKNAPSFLGYKSNIQQDTEFIEKYRDEIHSAILLKNIKLLINK
ncbi:MAG TPA: hypothetical protein VLZ83_01310 [Edaphocola sp.]|nr:hypothetical protein [Edaphocola sp.]